MTIRLPFELRIPLLYVNPPANADPRLIEVVSKAGGLGFVDHATAGPAAFSVQEGTPHGVRIRLDALKNSLFGPNVKACLIPLEDADDVARLDPGELKAFPVPVLVEVGSAAQAAGAEKAGAAALVARGNEGPGWVSERSGLVLLQEILGVCPLPVFLQGGIGLHTAAGAVGAGATGVVLDVHLLLTEESVINASLKSFFSALGIPATVTLGEAWGKPCRVYSRVGTRMVRELRKVEDSLGQDEFHSLKECINAALGKNTASLDTDDALLALSEDIVTAKTLAGEFARARAILEEFARRMESRCGTWPFAEESGLCKAHGTLLPIVQGPMAHVSDNPDFLAAVAQGGALPFLAMGNMPAPIAREGIELARSKTNGKFGVGLIGLEVNRHCYEAHLEIMKENPPPFAILAAGSVELAQRIEEMGTVCYLHCPAPTLVSEGVKAGLRHFVFEGCESGGHIGALGSLDLWEANLRELEQAARDGISLAEVSVLFAGGIATARASAFVAGMVADLAARGLRVGLQMGTAYLATSEAVSTCAITQTYHGLTLESDRTVVIGRTVNTRARAAASPMASQLIYREQERVRSGVPLRERKELYEKDNLGSLRLAAKGCAIDPSTATWDCPVFCDLPPKEQYDSGLYLMGQVVSLLNSPTTIEQLHREIIVQGREVFKQGSVHPEPQLQEIPELPETQITVEVEHPHEPIAIVGIGLRFPGSDSPEGFWDQIRSGRSGIIDVPPGRWDDPDFYYDPDPSVPDRTYSRIGGFIEGFVFDPLKYRIPPAVAQKMDRTQQMAVACVGDALADAKLSPDDLKGKRVGIILGNSMGGETTDLYATRVGLPRTLACLERSFEGLNVPAEAREELLERFKAAYLANLPVITEDSLPGELANVISGRVANVFNLEGPNFTVDAACASSMAAIMNAVAGLRDGTIDYAVTGGVDAAMHPSSFVKFCKIGALSPDGSRPFDAGANGFVMGEGCGILVLKRLSDAIRDNDRIYSTILEVGSSSDGKGKGITAPNAAGQERAVRAALATGNISAMSLGLIEAHGTSTAVGDKTELMVLDKLLRDAGLPAQSVGIGSIKSQIGHLKAAAGAAGVLKAALSLYHQTMPPTINVKNPNPCIDWETSPLFLVTEPRKWEPSGSVPRRAGASAFGFGGTNFHICLQEHVPGLRVIKGGRQEPQSISVLPPDWPKPAELPLSGEAWVLGAHDMQDLAAKIAAIKTELVEGNSQALASRCREAAPASPLRCGFAAVSSEEATKKLTLIGEAIADPKKAPALRARGIHFSERAVERSGAGIAFLFPGQGSQYPYMFRDLAEQYPVVAETFQEADEIVASLGLPPLTSVVFPDPGAAQDTSAAADAMKDTQLLQPMILTANTAMFRLLEQMGVRPVSCAGHSLGEYAACVAAGVFSFRDALEAVAVRGREMARVSIDDPGLMMSISADARLVEEVLSQVDGYVVAANKNSPKQTVISGLTHAVKQAAELFKARGLEGAILPVSAAFHSGVVAPAREPFMETLRRLTVKQPTVPVLSNVTGDFYPVGPAAPGKIRDLLGKQFAAPVEWVKTLRKMYAEGIRIFLECGPKRVLTNLTLDTLPGDVLALATNHPKKGGIMQLMEALAALSVEGVNFDLAGPQAAASQRKERPVLMLVKETTQTASKEAVPALATASNPLDPLLDPQLREVASKAEFPRYLELQAEPIRALIKTGFDTYLKSILPMEKTVIQVKSEGMDFQPVVISGISAGLPSDVRFPFDRETMDDLILGRNFIKRVPEQGLHDMVEKNIERLYKGPDGEAELHLVQDTDGVIKLAGYFSEYHLAQEYGIDQRLVGSMDVTTQLALMAGIEALKDAGIPLVRQTRTTSTGLELPDAWALPEPLRAETAVIFASAFPGLVSLVDELTREAASRYGSGARKRLIEFYTGLIGRVQDDKERDAITAWFSEEFGRINHVESEEVYSFNRSFLLRVLSMGSGQLAQFIRAQGPNSHVDAACASTTQAILLARDWIRTGQAKRVLVVAADDVAGKTLFPWIGSGFLAMGAATTKESVTEAALPFDDRRNGLILGSAAVGLVLEKESLTKKRGMEALAAIEAGISANSAYHGTRLDQDHISAVMRRMIEKWEEQTGRSRQELAKDVVFMSHETYSPKRGGSSAAEIQALRETFGDSAREIPIANTKGFTGHTMGAGVEDVVAIRSLQKCLIPPIPNLKQPDPEFADMNLSRGGSCRANHVLRLAAGFGSQIVMAVYKILSRQENRITDLAAHRQWLKEITGYADPVIAVEERTLRVVQRGAAGAAMQKAAVAEAEVAAKPTAGLTADAAEVREKILTLLSDKTGYPPDMLDTGLDLEADLGIDTVKQAEFISDVRETFGIPRIEGLKIADFPTIEHIIRFVLEHTGRQSDSTQGTAAGGQDIEAIQTTILQLLSDKTGYPPDMLDPDLDLEADLGIDTVKQAEFISEVRQRFGIPRIEGLKIADFPTIRHIVGFVKERSRHESPVQEDASKTSDEEKTSLAEPEVRLYEARLVRVPKPVEMPSPEADQVVIAGSSAELADALEEELHQLGYDNVQRISNPAQIEQHAATRIGVVNLFPLSKNAQGLKNTFDLYVRLAKSYEKGPSFLVTLVSQDGAYGFDCPTTDGYLSGAAAGATKSFAREFPESTVRLLDAHPDLDPTQTAQFLARSLKESFPLETGVAGDGWLRAIRLVPTMGPQEEAPLSAGDVILCSGGARGITASCLTHLARQGSFTFVILGRTALSDRAEQRAQYGPEQWQQEKTRIIDRMKRESATPTPVAVERELSRLQAEAEVFRTLTDLRRLGSEVIYRPVDIRDAGAVDKAVNEIAELCGRIDVVVHAAGIDVSRALKSKTLEQIESVVSVKVDGMRNLLDALVRHETLPRRIIGFGSVAGRFGNLAQVDYSAANDALAHLLRKADRELDAKVSIIDWAPWSEIGMAAKGSVQQTLESAGIGFIPPQSGAALFARELVRSSGPCEVVAAGPLGPFAPDAFEISGGPQLGEIQLVGHAAQVMALLRGEYLKVKVSLDPSQPLLDHHRIDRAAVLPGVGGMELMRSAALLLDTSAPTARFRNVRFRSPLKIFKNEPFEAEIEVHRVVADDATAPVYRATIASWFVDKNGHRMGQPRLHHECELVTGPKSPPDPIALEQWATSVCISDQDLYRLFFHGPGFRFLDHVRVEGNGKGVQFTFRDTPQRAAMFRDALPGAVEAAFQAAAAFAVESRGIMALPVGTGEVIVHQDGLPSRGELFLKGESADDATQGRKVLAFDGVIVDENGSKLLTLKHVEMIEFEQTAGFSGRTFEELVRVSDIAAEATSDSERLVETVLTDDEARVYKEKTIPKRAQEWLMGRIAMKRSIQRLLAQAGKGSIPEKDIRIAPDENGKPIVEMANRPGSRVCHVSLSHSNGFAVAMAGDLGDFDSLGIDLEKVEERSEAWAGDYFTDEEVQAAEQTSDKWSTLTAMWAVKEATLKALGTGLSFDLKDLSVRVPDGNGPAELQLRNEAAQYLENSFSGTPQARVETHNGTVTATVLIRG
ncbi:MAG: SDR family NAD(P)-dependent oxidoreductase [Thermodesulfobacteriota bacterium]